MNASDPYWQRLSLSGAIIRCSHDIQGVYHLQLPLSYNTPSNPRSSVPSRGWENYPPDKDIDSLFVWFHMHKVAAQRQWYKVTFSYLFQIKLFPPVPETLRCLTTAPPVHPSRPNQCLQCNRRSIVRTEMSQTELLIVMYKFPQFINTTFIEVEINPTAFVVRVHAVRRWQSISFVTSLVEPTF